MDSKFQSFLDDNHRVIAKVCRVYTDCSDDFNDYYQECIVQLWKSYQTFRGESKASTWVYRVCLNVCLSQLRIKKRTIVTTRDEIPDVCDDIDPNREERLEMLYRAIRKLKEADRAIMLLYLDEKSYKEMAEILGLTVTNVGAKVNRVKLHLKKIINERSGD